MSHQISYTSEQCAQDNRGDNSEGRWKHYCQQCLSDDFVCTHSTMGKNKPSLDGSSSLCVCHVNPGQHCNWHHPSEGEDPLYDLGELLAPIRNHSCSEVYSHEATCYYPNQTTDCRNGNQCTLYYSIHRIRKKKGR